MPHIYIAVEERRALSTRDSNMENISPMELFKSEMETPAELYYQEGFFRDPQRPVFNNGGCFYSPADGFILYQKIIAPDNQVKCYYENT